MSDQAKIPVKAKKNWIFTWGNKRPRRLVWWVGVYTLAYQAYDMTYASVMHNARDPLNLKQRYGEGTWAVISGANDPLSREFAKKFTR